MSNLKCPFCKETLQPIGDVDAKYPITSYYCPNNCIAFAFGNLPMWNELKRVYDSSSDWEKQALDYKAENIALSGELDRTRKALDVAVDALNKINMRCQNTVRNHLERATIRGELCDISFYARKAIDDIDNLEQITTLEQKDK